MEKDWVEIEYANPVVSVPKKILSENKNLEYFGARVTTDQKVYVFTFKQKDDFEAKQVEFAYSSVNGQIIQMLEKNNKGHPERTE